ncbi:hypothetical protein FB45DRAFT_923343 [Roridomyces roridus]|uniref:Uncharacterized protein n=1 Tax=Roridomyces roridus TaxID=1738132 RepID=A0AAD7BLB1_9AGAR|nr:hypothetical protein FB45DRAFT_923343 [Roridomyces roridus]
MPHDHCTLPTICTPSSTASKRKKPRLWMLIAALAALLLIGLAGFGRGRWSAAQEGMLSSFRPPAVGIDEIAPKPERIFLRAGDVGIEGLGSTLQHFKHSIVFSNALQSTLLFAANDGWSLRPYSTSVIYNGRRNFSVDASRACRIQAYIHHDEREGLVRGLCQGDVWAIERIDRIKEDMDACTSILDTEDHETINDLNGCTMGWVRERLAPSTPYAPLTAPISRPISVGIHIRWGDTGSTDPDEDIAAHNFYGSWSLPNIVRVLADLHSYVHPHGITLTIAMQNADPRVLAYINEPAYTLLDPGDSFKDLQELSQSDLLLLGESSYGVLAHLIAPPGLTIVEGGAL